FLQAPAAVFPLDAPVWPGMGLQASLVPFAPPVLSALKQRALAEPDRALEATGQDYLRPASGATRTPHSDPHTPPRSCGGVCALRAIAPCRAACYEGRQYSGALEICASAGRGGGAQAMAMVQPMRFGQVLKRYRTAAGLTQEALAERAGLSVRGI